MVQLLSVTVVLILTMVGIAHGQSANYGRFEGRVVAVWNADGRTMILVEDFAYTDPKEHRWAAPKGRKIDGASIPQVFWSFIGGPFEGEYRNASVVHDIACEDKTEPWREVHLMFYLASLLGGVNPLKAKIMYGAIYQFGPRWKGAGALSPAVSTLSTNDDFLRLQEFIRKYPDLPLSRIEEVTRGELEQEIPEIPTSVAPAAPK
jgi:hypothetical protein